jgi:hypothetical protein
MRSTCSRIRSTNAARTPESCSNQIGGKLGAFLDGEAEGGRQHGLGLLGHVSIVAGIGLVDEPRQAPPEGKPSELPRPAHQREARAPRRARPRARDPRRARADAGAIESIPLTTRPQHEENAVSWRRGWRRAYGGSPADGDPRARAAAAGSWPTAHQRCANRRSAEAVPCRVLWSAGTAPQLLVNVSLRPTGGLLG